MHVQSAVVYVWKMESEFETEDFGQPPSVAESESTIPDDASTSATSSQSSESSLSLLARLRSPRPSDLARKRQVKSNPPRGGRKGKGAVAGDPRSVSPSDRVKAFPGEHFTVSNYFAAPVGRNWP